MITSIEMVESTQLSRLAGMMHAGAGAGARKPELSHLLTSVGRLSIRRSEVRLEELNPKLDFVRLPTSDVGTVVALRCPGGTGLADDTVAADFAPQVPTRSVADELGWRNGGGVLCN